jgi:hypothetical protein
MGYKTANYMEKGGKRWMIGGKIGRPGDLRLDELQSALVQHYQITPASATATAIHAAVTLADGEPTTVTTEITNPDVPRTVTIKGNAAGITGDVVITGTNILDGEITDTIALNGSTEVEGVKAFKTVTQIVLPARTQAADTVSVGMAKKFGMPHIVAYPLCVIVKLFNGAADSGSLAVDADIEKNLFALNGAPNGTKIVDLYYLA